MTPDNLRQSLGIFLLTFLFIAILLQGVNVGTLRPSAPIKGGLNNTNKRCRRIQVPHKHSLRGSDLGRASKSNCGVPWSTVLFSKPAGTGQRPYAGNQSVTRNKLRMMAAN